MRRIGVISVARSDYGILRPVLERIVADDELELLLYVSGAHLDERFGHTVNEIEADGFPIAERIPLPQLGADAASTATALGALTDGIAGAYDRTKPDLLVVLGDRIEMLAAVAAAMPFGIPIAHLHGGERSEGSLDELTRHALTKLSHLHFPATEEYARRIEQMGEESWRVTVAGAPGLDNLKRFEPLSRDELRDRFAVDADEPFLLVTFHPSTLAPERTESELTALLAALERSGLSVIATYPGADPGGRAVAERLEQFAASANGNVQLVTSLGTDGYFTLMSKAAAMVGNSSSGIIEAASFQLPVVNVGDRQDGRVRATNVIDAPAEADAIAAAIERATSPEFRKSLGGLVNPYGDGKAAERIVARLRSVELDERLRRKSFEDRS
jgi:UDP-hydrolysing UDP-N-acetyl-D-glucosamine 2-epimerase